MKAKTKIAVKHIPSALDRPLALIAMGYDRLEKRIKSGKASASDYRELAGLARASATLSAEERAGLKLRNRELDALDYDKIIAWARRQGGEMRAQLVRDLSALDEERSVLA